MTGLSVNDLRCNQDILPDKEYHAILHQCSCLGRDSNPLFPESDSEASPLAPACSVRSISLQWNRLDTDTQQFRTSAMTFKYTRYKDRNASRVLHNLPEPWAYSDYWKYNRVTDKKWRYTSTQQMSRAFTGNNRLWRAVLKNSPTEWNTKHGHLDFHTDFLRTHESSVRMLQRWRIIMNFRICTLL